MGLPNSRGQTFAGDVAHCQSEDGVEFHHFEKISRKMTDGKNFAGDLELARGELAWGAEPALHLSGFINGLLQLCLFATHRIQFLFDRLDVLRRLSSPSEHTLTAFRFGRACRCLRQVVPERVSPHVWRLLD